MRGSRATRAVTPRGVATPVLVHALVHLHAIALGACCSVGWSYGQSSLSRGIAPRGARNGVELISPLRGAHLAASVVAGQRLGGEAARGHRARGGAQGGAQA